MLGSGGRLLWLRLSSYGEKMQRRKVRLSDIFLFGHNQHWKNNIKCSSGNSLLMFFRSKPSYNVFCFFSSYQNFFIFFLSLFFVIIWHSHTCILAIFISQFSLNLFPPPSTPYYQHRFLIFFLCLFVFFSCVLCDSGCPL